MAAPSALSMSSLQPPVFQNTLGIPAWNLMPAGSHSQPGVGQASAPVPGSQGAGTSFITEIPVVYNVSLRRDDQYNKYIESADLLFRIRPVGDRMAQDELRSKCHRVLNLASLNDWLRKMCQAAETTAEGLLQTPNNPLAPLMAGKEAVLNAALFPLDADKQSTFSHNDALALQFLTAEGIQRALCYLGPNASQSNLVRQQDIREGSLSASQGHTEVAVGSRGPFDVRNVWGGKATLGKYLWLQIRRDDEGARSTKLGGLSRMGQFEVKPWVSDTDCDRRVDGAALSYTGYAGYSERCVNILVGQVVMRGRRTVRDDRVLEQASNTGTKRDVEQAYLRAQTLEVLKVAVAPSWGGLYVQWA